MNILTQLSDHGKEKEGIQRTYNQHFDWFGYAMKTDNWFYSVKEREMKGRMEGNGTMRREGKGNDRAKTTM